MGTEERPREDAGRRRPSTRHGERRRRNRSTYTSGAMRGAVLLHKLQPTLLFGGPSCITVIGETASNRSPEEGTELTQRGAGTERALCSEQ